MKRSHWRHGMRTARRNSTANRPASRRRRQPLVHRRPLFEPLEERTLLATLTVNSPLDNVTPGDGLVTLREAIIAANTNTTTDLGHTCSGADTIQFAPAVFSTPHTIELAFGDLLISANVTIGGPGQERLTIDAKRNSRLFDITAGVVTISGLTLTNGQTTGDGGAIRSLGRVILDRSVVSGNIAGGSGGAIYSRIPVIVTNSTISNNQASGSGGGIFVSNLTNYFVSVTSSTISGNTCGGSGGGLYAAWGGTFTDSRITDNTASGIGGGFRVRSHAALTGSLISGNKAANYGGGFAVTNYRHGGGVELTNCTISGNSTDGDGGGFFATYAKLTNCVVNGNTAMNVGGGFAASGSDIGSIGSATLINSTVRSNKAMMSGGGFATGGNVTLNNSIVSSNVGGGIFSRVPFNRADLTLNSSTVSGNTATGPGGGIHWRYGNVAINSSTVDGNQSQSTGGGIYSGGANVALDSATLSGNSAATAGGGIYRKLSQYSGIVSVEHSTITNNHVTNGDGGGIWSGLGRVEIIASIIAGNSAAQNADVKPGATLSYSLLGDNAGTGLAESHTPDANGNLIGSAAGSGIIDARLAPLADNGGPTRTHALFAGSPAIDAIPSSFGPPAAHDYQLNNSLADLLGGPSLTALGGNLQPTGYAFGNNQGLDLSSALANPVQYSIEIVFRWNAITGGWYKILDFHNLTSNVGLYTAGTGLYFLDRAFAPDRFTANTFAQLVITRDDATDTVRAYINGTLAWSFVDAAGEAVFDGPNQIMRFFQDDNVTGQSQAQAGFADRVRIYNEVLSAEDIQDINTPPPFPFPQFDQRGEPFARVRDGNGDGVPQVDMGAYELQSAANMPPVFTSPDAASVPENTTAVLTVTATDDLTPPQAITYAIVGGVDQARFNITTGGALTFKSPPDFEAPADANGDNVYLVIVEASDGSLTSLQAVVVTITPVNDASPVFTSPSAVGVVEGTTAVTTLAATDTDLPPQTVTFAIAGGADQLKFTLTDGMLRFIAPPNFAMPGDADGNNVYEVEVRADDGQGRTTLQTILVTVTSPPADYGDAPDASAGTGTGNYQTRASDNGPRHTIVPGLRLGANVDDENGTLENGAANADDVNAALPDDEDGVSNPAADLALTIGAQPTVALRATNTTGMPATLYGWIDYNANGVFENATERASVAVPAGTNNGIVTLVFPAVPPGYHGTTYARFRLSTDTAAEPTGAAADGEVEDYRATIVRPSDLTAEGNKTKLLTRGVNGVPNLGADDLFGSSIATIGDLDGDGVQDMAVGAVGDDTGGSNRGSLHVLFMSPNGSVRNTLKIANNLNGGPAIQDFDTFGQSVTTIGDLDGNGVTDIAVGAGGSDMGGINRGAVYVLLLNLGGTVKGHQVIASGIGGGPILSDNNAFGSEVASIGDLDGDGINDLAATAPGENGERGALYILYLNSNGTARAVQKIAGGIGGLPALTTSDRFGSGLASTGDLDGDGVADLAVGVPGDDVGGYNHGAVHILFMRANGTIKNVQKIANGVGGGPPVGNDGFGLSIAALGDIDGDGVTDLAVGAPGDDTGGSSTFSERGAVHLLLLNTDGTVKASEKIAHNLGGGPTLANTHRFGNAVASLGDLDGDGLTDIAVGGDMVLYGRNFPGAVHVLFLKTQNQNPVFTSPSTASVPENTSSVMTVTATDADVPPQTVTFSLVGGADQGRFTITAAGALSFQAAPDFDVPGDANGDNVYEVIVQASDGNFGTATQTIQVTVTPVNDNTPVFTSPDVVSVPENITTPVLTVTATDADRPPQTITYALVGGSDQAKFNITPSGALSFKSPPDFEAPGDANGDNLYILIVQASDGTRSDLQVVLVTVTNAVNEQSLAGDYNMSGAVDAADYVLWRNSLGTSVPPFSGADGSGNGVVDQADYAVWRANFGRSLPPASGAFLPPVAPDTSRGRSSSYRPARRPGAPVAQADNTTTEQALAAWLAARPAAADEWLPGDELAAWSPPRRPSERSEAAATALDLAFAAL